MDDSGMLRYRFRYWPLNTACTICAIILASAWVYLRLGPQPPEMWLLTVGLSGGLTSILILVMVLVFRARIDGDGLHGQDFWGKSLKITFAGITGARLLRLPLISFYRIRHAADEREMWLPRFVDDEQGFIREACARMDEENPFRVLLEARAAELGIR